MLKFLKDTAVEQVTDHHWRGTITPDWNIATVPNGGYIMALGARALQSALSHSDPLTVTAYYMAPTEPGPVDCDVEVLRSGGSTSHGIVRLLQHGQVRVLMVGVFTNQSRAQGESRINATKPDIAPYQDCAVLSLPPEFTFSRQVVQRVNPGQEHNFLGKPDDSGRLSGWIEFADGATTDPLSILLFADGFPPPVFTYFGPTGWVPTLELTVQMRGIPAQGPVQCHFQTQYLTDGVMEEDGYLWDCEGQLVAISRQTAKLRRTPS